MDKLATEIAELIMFIAKLLGFGKKEAVPSTDNTITIALEPENLPVVESNREKLYKYALSKLGVDMAPTQDTLGCAESLSHILKGSGLTPLTGIFMGTYQLNEWLSKNLEKVSDPLPGDIIMSETGSGIIRGHCGIVGKHKIMSNNSASFLWDDHWTLSKWKDYYGTYGKLPIRFYRVK